MWITTPTTLAEALETVVDRPAALPVAGGLELMLDRAVRGIEIVDIVQIGHLAELRGVHMLDDGSSVIGAATSYAQLAASDALPRAITAAARDVGGPQIRSQGTIGGGICSFSAHSDVVVALLACGAQVTVSGRDGNMHIGLARFLLDLRAGRRPVGDALLTRITVPPDGPGASAFGKLARRRGFAQADVSCAARFDAAGGRIRAVVGGVTVPRRLPTVERQLSSSTDDRADGDADERRRPAVVHAARLDLAGVASSADRELAARFVGRVVCPTPRQLGGRSHEGAP